MSDKSSTAILSCVGAIVLIPVLTVGSYLVNGWVLTILWGWFVVPVFHLPLLTIVPAIGLAMVVGFLTYQTMPESGKKKESYEVFIETIARTFLSPLMTLAAAYVVHSFMVTP